MKELEYNELMAAFPSAKPAIITGIVDNQSLLDEYEVNTNLRRNYFLAQVAHESDGFRTTREYASGAGYEGRMDLGNTVEGDGVRFRGRGLIQLTGRANYRKYGEIMGIDIVSDPVSVERMPLALEISLAYWEDRNLNMLADKQDFRGVTRRINGGYNGMASREAYLRKFQRLYPET